jgi:hypothetical protein
MSERKQIINQVKELGIKTSKPAHMCSTTYLKELLPKEEVKIGFFKKVLRGLGF